MEHQKPTIESMREALSTNSTVARMRQLGNLKPRWSWGFGNPGKPDPGIREVLPFRRSWIAIFVLCIFAGVFSMPLFLVPFDFAGIEDLFDLTSNLFSLFWLMGWSVGVLAIITILVAMIFAREVLIIEPDRIRLRVEMFFLGIQAEYDSNYISNLRYVSSPGETKGNMRGRHLVFDYFDVPVSFGSDIDHNRSAVLCSRINAALARPVPLRLSAAAKALMAEEKAQSREQEVQIQPDVPEVTGDAGIPEGKTSLYLLVVANLVPLAGIALFDWEVADIMLLFWFESAIIGFFNILKMFRIAGPAAIFYSLFFIAHFGAFMAVHLMFIFGLFIEEGSRSATLAEVGRVFLTLWPGILALFISHGFSFVENFLRRREYLHTTIREQMGKPYNRVVVMHVTIIFGGFLILALKLKSLALALLIVMKIGTDLSAHNKSHK